MNLYPNLIDSQTYNSQMYQSRYIFYKDLYDIIEDRQQLEEFYSENLIRISNNLDINLSKYNNSKDDQGVKECMRQFKSIMEIQGELSKCLQQQIKSDILLPYLQMVKLQKEQITSNDKFAQKIQKEINLRCDNFNESQKKYMSPSKDQKIQSQLVDQYIDEYNQFVDQYMLECVKNSEIYQQYELNSRNSLQDSLMKFMIYQISYIRNIQYDLDKIAKKIEEQNVTTNYQEIYKYQIKENQSYLMKINKQQVFEKLDNKDFAFVSSFKTKDFVDWNKYSDVITTEKLNVTWEKFVNKIQNIIPKINEPVSLDKQMELFVQKLLYQNLHLEIDEQLILQTLQKPDDQLLFSDVFYSKIRDPSKKQKLYEFHFKRQIKILNYFFDIQDSNDQIYIKQVKNILNYTCVIFNENEESMTDEILNHKFFKNEQLWLDYLIKNQHQQKDQKIKDLLNIGFSLQWIEQKVQESLEADNYKTQQNNDQYNIQKEEFEENQEQNAI